MSNFSLSEMEDIYATCETLGEFIDFAAETLNEEENLPFARDSAIRALKLAQRLNSSNKDLFKDKQREHIEQLLTPFIIRANELLEDYDNSGIQSLINENNSIECE